eukprot:TRINITY_DN54721_c0_g1_i1.p1 TRINITY_DN54721_c0_g1~~TRINITY_DN54721_c0_g1_i1.p1  ORF type:complete len:717 (+),score=108.79 TRINITY_DN54721_c0_g1_i1:174-2153(+)
MAETQMHVLRRANIRLREVNNKLSLEVQDLEDCLTEEGKELPEVEYECGPDEAIEKFLHESSNGIKEEHDKLKAEHAAITKSLEAAKNKSNDLVTQAITAPSSPKAGAKKKKAAKRASGGGKKKTEKEWTADYKALKKQYLKVEAAAKKLKAKLEEEPATPTTAPPSEPTPPPAPPPSEDFEKISAELAAKAEELRSQLDAAEQAEAEKAKLLEEKKHERKVREKKLKKELEKYKTKADEEKEKIKSQLSEYEERLQSATQETEELISKKSAEAEHIRTLTQEVATAETRIEEVILEKQTQYDELLMKYKREERNRRKLYNELQELKGNIRVLCRLKPVLEASEKGQDLVVDVIDFDLAVAVNDPAQNKNHKFEFDRCFGPTSKQVDVYGEVKPLAMSVLDGYNVCIFAYGQTGSGKTYTMEGPPIPEQRGINYRSVKELYEISFARSEHYTTKISISVVEIYNDVIFDLLNGRHELKVKGITKSGVEIPDITIVPTANVDEVVETLYKGYACRKTASTGMNDQSSRSHCILTVYTEVKNLATGVQVGGKLNLVDLAGSERLKSTHAEGARKKEAQFINTSLTVLKRVMSALGSREQHIPYRDCTLTRMLQDSLGGNCKCLMFANISMVASNCSETVSTLKFASDCRSVELGKAEVNVK